MSAILIGSSYEDRAANHPSPVAARLLKLMGSKKTNLCASLDVQTTDELLALCDKVGPYVCCIKTHIDIIKDFDYGKTVGGLKEMAEKHEFLIFEDRKFADIGSTVKSQYTGGIFKIAEWSDFTNAHGVPGPGIVQGLRSGAKEVNQGPRGLLMLAELSSQGSLAVGKYTEKTIQIARQFKDYVFGFIAQHRMSEEKGEDWLILTPGVGLDDKNDGLGQQYRTVDEVVAAGSDVIIVGRGLFGNGRDPKTEAKRYRDAAWSAYLNRLA